MNPKPRLSRLACLAVMPLLCVLSLGCGPGALQDRPQGEVSGTVTVDDKPLPDGEITFSKVADGVNEMLPVKDGKFSGKVSQGDRKVEIRAYKEEVDKAAAAMYGDKAPKSKVNYIPAKFNTESTLKAEVKAGVNPPLEFAATSQ